MYGSILYNCWSALVGFTIYFILALQNQFAAPLAILIGSFIAAIGTFLLMFPIRYLLQFILFTPEPVELAMEESVQMNNEESRLEEQPFINQSNSVEFEDANTEDIAKVVRTMMHQDGDSQTAS